MWPIPDYVPLLSTHAPSLGSTEAWICSTRPESMPSTNDGFRGPRGPWPPRCQTLCNMTLKQHNPGVHCNKKTPPMASNYAFHFQLAFNFRLLLLLIIVTLRKVAGVLYISDLKNDGSSQKSVVRQLKHMGLCLPSERQQRRGGPDLCWQTVPRPRRCHRKGAVARSYPRSWRHQQRSLVGRAKMATGDKL